MFPITKKYFSSSLFKTIQSHFYILFSLFILGFLPLNAQNIDIENSNLLKPLIIVGSDVLALEEYCNTRFDYCVSYPDELFDLNRVSSNDDGRTWVSHDGNIRLTVYGTNSLDWTLQEEYNRWREVIDANSNQNLNLKTNILSNDYFEMEGTVDGENYYQKTHLNESGSQFITLIFRSKPSPLKNKYLDDLQETVADSFTME